MLTFSREGFRLDGKPLFLISGEIHYFRVRKKDWPRHFERMKSAGLDAVTTYIPWSWHEIKEGQCDLTGETNPDRDIVGFFDLCREFGLKAIVKPGPYILAEYLDQGIPKWFLKKHPEVLVQDDTGRNNIAFVASYMHPKYLEYGAKWYDHIIPVLKDHQISNGGPIIMMQICNEVGLQQWLAGCGDYNPVTLGYYSQFLTEKYKDVQTLNEVYTSEYISFDKVTPPHGNMESRSDIARYYDWHEFHRWYYSIYLDTLMSDLTKRGIQIPFYENVPGWVYGRAHELPPCITMYSKAIQKRPELLLGLDHIPENVDFRNCHDAAIVSGMVQAMQGRKMPLFSAEFQAGSREHCVRTYPNELQLFYKSVLACGTQGWNYYMFSQGKNPKGEGVYGPTFYWDTPLDDRGKENPQYETCVEINRWIKINEENLVLSQQKSDVGVAFYKPYYETEFYYPLFLKDKYFRPEKADLKFDIKTMRDIFFYEGLLKALYILNFPPDIFDPQVQSIEELAGRKVIWAFCLEMMDPETQGKWVELVKTGACIVFYPYLPKFDLEGRPCEILRKGLGVFGEEVVSTLDPKVSYFDQEPVSSLGLIHSYHIEGATVIASAGNQACGFEKKIGKGRAIILGTFPNYQIEEHLDVFTCILEREGVKREFRCDDPDIVIQKRESKGGAFIFVLNFHPVDKEFNLMTDDLLQEMKIPATRKLSIGATSGLILPYHLKLKDANAEIVYATSEYFGHQWDGQNLTIQLKARQGVNGEIIVRLPSTPQRVLCNGKEILWTPSELGCLVKYRHSAKDLILEINL